MKAVELFAGIGGFRIACDNLGVRTIWANDIDSKAACVYRDQFGSDAFIEGDIYAVNGMIPAHDLLTGGFPCQPFSSAGKKKGIYDTRGTLFDCIVTILKTHSPKYFVLENVKRLLSMDQGRHFAHIITALSQLGYLLEWRILNAIHFGLPQHRERLVIIGQKSDKLISYLCEKSDLDSQCDGLASYMLNTNSWKIITDHKRKFHNWGMARNGKFFDLDVPTFSASVPKVFLKDVLEEYPDKDFFFTENTLERIKLSEEVNRFFNGVEILYNQKGGARMGYSIFGVSGVASTLTSTTSRHYERYKVGNDYRRLTNVEYARIQGFPDNHCKAISRYHQYSLYGNAVPPQLVEWVIHRLIVDKHLSLKELPIQMAFL